jgi:hypothetical protein
MTAFCNTLLVTRSPSTARSPGHNFSAQVQGIWRISRAFGPRVKRWSTREEVQKIWFSLYTPQEGEQSEERLSTQDRASVVRELARLRGCFPKVEFLNLAVYGYLHPPSSPQECIFAQATTCISADLTTRITPCLFGGRPVCAECGCAASALFNSIGKHKLGALVPLSDLFVASRRTGELFSRFRQTIRF